MTFDSLNKFSKKMCKNKNYTKKVTCAFRLIVRSGGSFRSGGLLCSGGSFFSGGMCLCNFLCNLFVYTKIHLLDHGPI